MSWLLWRQHRLQSAVFAAIIAALSLGILLSIRDFDSAAKTVATTCPGGSCQFGSLVKIPQILSSSIRLTLAFPLLLGIFFGAVLVTREVEQKTHILAWTQGITRRRWLLSKLSFALGATVLASGLVSLMVGRWYGRSDDLYRVNNRFDPSQFELLGLVPIGYAIFALGVGLLLGALLRRSLPALAGTLGAFFVARLGFANYLRPHLMHPIVQDHLGAGPGNGTPGSWVLSSVIYSPRGQVRPGLEGGLFKSCTSETTREAFDACVGKLGFHTLTSYQPASRYWSFQ